MSRKAMLPKECWICGRQFSRVVRKEHIKRYYKNKIHTGRKLCSVCDEAMWRFKRSGRNMTREAVRVRDKFTCQDCGAVRTRDFIERKNAAKRRFGRTGLGGSLLGLWKALDVHHIDGNCGKKSRMYDSIHDMKNLITLCHKCHFRRHDFSNRVNGVWKKKA